jgi:HSP20 family protein
MTHHSSVAPSRKIGAEFNLTSANELSQHTQDIFDLIARRAFEIFEGRGCAHGNDREDWLLAESELLKPVEVNISQSSEQVTASVEVPGFSRQEIRVSVEPRRLIISGKAESREDHGAGKQIHSLKHEHLMFRIVDLPTEVDPSKAKATFNDGMLEVLMPKEATPAKSVRAETRIALSA